MNMHDPIHKSKLHFGVPWIYPTIEPMALGRAGINLQVFGSN